MALTFSLAGKVALVTGASRGIGAAIATELARAGANVVCHGRARLPEQSCAAVRELGRETLAVRGDLAERQDQDAVVTAAVKRFGQLDILINNAGMILRRDAVDYSDEDWDLLMELNLTSVFRMSRLAGRHMLERGAGCIVNIASLLSFQGGIRVPAYSASKAGVAVLTKALANEWSAHGVNVNAIAPGYIATDNTEQLRADPARSRQILERIPAGRWGAAEDIAGAAVFLCSDAARYVHGHVLVVDGGWMGR